MLQRRTQGGCQGQSAMRSRGILSHAWPRSQSREVRKGCPTQAKTFDGGPSERRATVTVSAPRALVVTMKVGLDTVMLQRLGRWFHEHGTRRANRRGGKKTGPARRWRTGGGGAGVDDRAACRTVGRATMNGPERM